MEIIAEHQLRAIKALADFGLALKADGADRTALAHAFNASIEQRQAELRAELKALVRLKRADYLERCALAETKIPGVSAGDS